MSGLVNRNRKCLAVLAQVEVAAQHALVTCSLDGILTEVTPCGMHNVCTKSITKFKLVCRVLDLHEAMTWMLLSGDSTKCI